MLTRLQLEEEHPFRQGDVFVWTELAAPVFGVVGTRPFVLHPLAAAAGVYSKGYGGPIGIVNATTAARGAWAASPAALAPVLVCCISQTTAVAKHTHLHYHCY